MTRAKLDDVARRAGVSKATASRALNGIGELSDETRKSVVLAAEALHYRPSPLARSLRTRRSHTVGLVVPTDRVRHERDGPYTEDLLPFVDQMMNNRIAVRVVPARTRSWDHRKLGMPDMPVSGSTAQYLNK